jgi:hypothetical protein
MIQVKRGKTSSWTKLKKPLAAGQPGYDKDKHILKIGDGETSWEKLPYTGLSSTNVLDSETQAEARYKKNNYDTTIITYGKEIPNKDTIGKIYLQTYDAEPEVDYVVESGIDDIWTYQKWQSGVAKCWGTYKLTTGVNEAFTDSSLYYNSTDMETIEYPVDFVSVPSELASVCSTSGVVWLASNGANTEKEAASYRIISPTKLDSANYNINFCVSGLWK